MFGSLIYSRTISMVLRRTSGHWRMIATLLLMIFIGSRIYMSLSDLHANNNMSLAKKIGVAEWDDGDKNNGKYVCRVYLGEEEHKNQVLSVMNNVIIPVFEVLGRKKFCECIKMVGIEKGLVEYDLLSSEIFVSFCKENTSDRVFEKIFEAAALIENYSYRHIFLTSILIPVAALMIIITSTVLGGYIGEMSDISKHGSEEQGSKKRRLVRYAIIYLIGICLVALISLAVYRILHATGISVEAYVKNGMYALKNQRQIAKSLLSKTSKSIYPGEALIGDPNWGH